MIKLDEIYYLLDSKINSDESEYFEIIHESEAYETSGIWYFKVSMFGEKIKIDNPSNLCIYDEVYKHLLNKYGKDNVDIIIPRGTLSEKTGVEVYVENIYVKCVPYLFSSEIYKWIDEIEN